MAWSGWRDWSDGEVGMPGFQGGAGVFFGGGAKKVGWKRPIKTGVSGKKRKKREKGVDRGGGRE